MENVEQRSSGSVDGQVDDASDHSGSAYTEPVHTESVEDLDANDTSDQESDAEETSLSEYEFDDDESDNDVSDVSDCSSSDIETVGCHVADRDTTRINNRGTVASISDIVNCCVFGSAACSLRYNKKGLQRVRRRLCAMPLNDTSLGTRLRIKPMPSPNRALDVNLCYLRYSFMGLKELLPTITLNKRCKVSDIRIETLSEMMFQAILMRYTGRIYSFEQYRLFAADNRSLTEQQHKRGMPFREECERYLEYVKVHMQRNKRTSLNSWMSKQHSGAIATDLKNCYDNFRAFVETIAKNVGDTVQHMMTQVNTSTSGHRAMAIGELQNLLEDAMEFGHVRDYGRVKWMSYIIICDIEEFLVDPFGIVDSSTITEGNYSLVHGHDMVNRAKDMRVPFQQCINEIVSYIYHNTPEPHLRILGFEKTVTWSKTL
jgi:hypothetical protein